MTKLQEIMDDAIGRIADRMVLDAMASLKGKVEVKPNLSAELTKALQKSFRKLPKASLTHEKPKEIVAPKTTGHSIPPAMTHTAFSKVGADYANRVIGEFEIDTDDGDDADRPLNHHERLVQGILLSNGNAPSTAEEYVASLMDEVRILFKYSDKIHKTEAYAITPGLSKDQVFQVMGGVLGTEFASYKFYGAEFAEDGTVIWSFLRPEVWE